MLIASRNSAEQLSPYDAEVEYLESTGTQWIDTGVVPNSTTTEVWLRTLLPSGSVAVPLFGSRSAANRNAYNAFYYPSEASYVQNAIRYDFGDASTISIVQNLINGVLPGWVVIETGGNNISIAGDGLDRTVTARLSTASNAFTIYVFAINTGGTPTTMQNRIVVSSMQIRVSGVLVRDFIPVRVGNVGYLYDRVSGELFGNAGTGAFEIGPDKSRSN